MFNFADTIPASFIAPGGKRLTAVAYVFLVLLCLGFYTPGLATLPPTDRDESSFAQATKQMIETNDYLHINFQAKPRYNKPIGIYWLQAASVKLLNAGHLEEIWAYRLPSVIGAMIAVLMTAALGALLFTPTIGLLAGIMMAGCTVLDFEAHLAKTDAMLLATIMVAQFMLARAYMGRSGWGGALVFWSSLACGLLIKGPVILLVVASTLVWLRVADKNLKWFARLKPYAGIPYLLALTIPWFVFAASATDGQFLLQSAGRDMLDKIWHGQDRGVLPPGIHLLVFPAMFFPFSLIAMLGAPDAWEDRRDKAVRFCLGWIIPAWIVFELTLTKLPHYVLPTYPAIALLAARSLMKGYPLVTEKNRHWLIVAAVTVWLMAGAFIVTVLFLLPEISDQSWDVYAFIAGFVLLLAQGVALFILPRHKIGSVVVLILGGLIFSEVAFGETLPGLQHLWASREVVQMAEFVKPCEQTKIAAAGYEDPSLVFLGGTDTKIELHAEQVVADMRRDPCRVGVIDGNHLGPFLEAISNGGAKPYQAANIHGYDLGHGGWTDISFYVFPPHVPEFRSKNPR